MLILGLGCQDPFAEGRHDLASFRIAAVGATAVEDGLRVEAVVYSGEGLWWSAVPSLVWEAGGVGGEGPATVLAVAPPVEVTLTATHPDGREERAVLALDAAPSPPALAGLDVGVTALTLDDIADAPEARAAVAAGEAGVVPVGGAARLVAEGLDGDERVRWMATAGQFAEIDAVTADWFAGTAELDDGEVVASDPLQPALVSFLGLALDGEGGNAWAWAEVPVGLDGPFFVAGSRWFPADAATGEEGAWLGTLAEDPSPLGLRLTDLVPDDGAAAADPVCGQGADEVFDPARVAAGWCARDEVLGARVRVTGRPW